MREIIVTNKRKIESLSKRIIYQTTEFTSSFGLKMGIEKSGLICLLFHAVSSAKSHNILPVLGFSIAQYRQIIESFLDAGYIFVSAEMICEGLSANGKFIHVTFDDGYFNNLEILPLLEEYGIPAQIFVATSNIMSNRKYWWDVVYKEMYEVGKNQAEISKSIELLKKRHHRDIFDYLVSQFGLEAFAPGSDIDRPLAPDELQELAKHSLITVGNHTRDHIIVDQSSSNLVHEQVVGAQKDLESIIGYEPYSFAYPNGNYNNYSIELLEQLGFKLGFSCDFRVNNVKKDLLGKRRLKLGRFSFISTLDLDMQCKMFRASRISPIVLLKRLRKFVR